MKAKHTGIGKMINAKITELKGVCNCGHEVGDTFELSCHSADGLCGFFYHEIFPKLSVMQYGGKYPWWEEGQSVFEAECPDRKNAVTLRLEVKPRD